MSLPTGGSSAPEARNLRSSWKREGTAGSKRRLSPKPRQEADMAHALDSYAAERDRTARLFSTADGLGRFRDDAWSQFVTMGFPTTQLEEWRFTNVASIADGRFVLAGPPKSPLPAIDIEPFRITDAAAELVFVEGHYLPSLSRSTALARDVRVESLARALAEHPERPGRHL